MALIHIARERGQYAAYGYGGVNYSDSPIGAFIGLKLKRMHKLGLIGNKYPMTRYEWVAEMTRILTNKYSHTYKRINKEFSVRF